MKTILELSRRVLDALLPNHCLHCDRPSPDYICASCYSACPIELKSFNFDLLKVWAVTPYDGVSKTAFHHLKFEGHTPLMDEWARVLNQLPIPPLPVAFDTWTVIPGSSDRIRRRRWDVTSVLFKKWLPFPADRRRTLLRRIRHTAPLFELSPSEREKELSGAFCLAEDVDVTGQRLLLVDDILTLGTTMRACASVLYHAGAADVQGFALCYPSR